MDNSENNKPLHIAYVIEKFPSPTEYFVLNEILELEKHFVNILILVLKKTNHNINITNLSTLKAPIYYCSTTSIFFLLLKLIKNYKKIPILLYDKQYFRISNLFKQLKYLMFAIYCEKQIENAKITQVHAHFAFIATDVGYLLSRLLNVNFSFTAHAQDIYINKNQISKKVEIANCILTCTKHNERYIKQLTEHKYDNKIYQIYHGIDINGHDFGKRMNPANTKVLRVLSVSRLVEKKGIIYLLKAIKILTDNKINIICKIIGDGHLRNELKHFVDKSGIQSQVVFLGMKDRNEVLKEMSVADVFILPCIVAKDGDMDGLPNVLIEAMLVGVPVITTSASGIPELIESGRTGLLVPEKDENAIVNSILIYINDPILYHSIVIGARNKVLNDFNIEESTKKLIYLFKKYAKD